jgi:GNAT superfamily N-acetyltransferase
MGDTIVIRAAVDRDVPAMASIRANDSQSQDFWEDRIRAYLEGTHSPQQALPERACWVAVHGEQVVGFVAGHRTRRFECDGELQWIDVVAGFRGRGVAHRLIALALSWFRSQGMHRICVNVSSENAPARHLYAMNGAIPLSAGWMEWRDLRQSGLVPAAAHEN